jgi:hypothetical protein
MHRAFNIGGRKAIEKVMKTQPAVFLKLLVLLVPREMEVTHSNAIKSMTDEQIEATIAAIQDMSHSILKSRGSEDLHFRLSPSCHPFVGRFVGSSCLLHITN